MTEIVRGHRGQIEPVGTNTPIVETGLPGGMTMARGEAGGWIIRDSEGQVQGLGRDPEGAIFAVFKVGEVYGVLNGWNSFNRKREEGEGL
ncbi:MAG: hypothetical protein AAB532_03355 [Patescibacteria group bacterium]